MRDMMSIEEKAKRFDEALEGVKEILSSRQKSIKMSELQQHFQNIFPELDESEIIKAEIMSYLLQEYTIKRYISKDEYERWISWLEKQQDNTNIEQVFRPLAGCCIDIAAKQAIEQQKTGKNVVLAFNGCYIPVENNTVDEIVNKYNAWLEKQGTKSNWSDEDEKVLKRIDSLLYSLCQIHESEHEELHNWLKLLKDKCNGA